MPLVLDQAGEYKRNEALAMAKLAQAGTFIKYHEGFLAFDGERDTSISLFADQFYKLYLDGWVELFQRKIDDMKYEYLAQTMGEIGRAQRALKNYNLYMATRTTNKQYISTKPLSAAGSQLVAKRGRPRLVGATV